MTLHSRMNMDFSNKKQQSQHIQLPLRPPNFPYPLPFAQVPNLPTLPHMPLRLPFALPLHLPLFHPLPPAPVTSAMTSNEEKGKPVTSFSISDILNGTIGRQKLQRSSSLEYSPAPKRRRENDVPAACEARLRHRPIRDNNEHDVSDERLRHSATPNEEDDDVRCDVAHDVGEEIEICDDTTSFARKNETAKSSPLDALFKMTSKTFESVGSTGILNIGKLQIFYF